MAFAPRPLRQARLPEIANVLTFDPLRDEGVDHCDFIELLGSALSHGPSPLVHGRPPKLPTGGGT